MGAGFKKIIMAPAAPVLDGAGPFLLGALAFFGVFARGGANIAYGLLFLWGLWLAAVRSGLSAEDAPPRRWRIGLAAFVLTWLAAVLAGGHYAAGLKVMADRLFLLALPLWVWLALSRRPAALAWLPVLWGLGLMAAAVLTWREGGWRLACLRAKAHLGIIELGSVLGQLIPLMTGAFLEALLAGRKKQGFFFALALVAAGLAMAQNCSRQTFLAAPALALFMVWAYRRRLGFRLAAAGLALIIALSAGAIFAAGGQSRFTEMGVGKTTAEAAFLPDSSEKTRLALWRQGWETFKAHPVLGVGPGAAGLGGGLIKAGGHAHQTFINVLAETGLVGFLGFLALHLAPLSLIWPRRHSRDPAVFFWIWAALAVNLQFLLNGLTDQIFGLRPLMYIHWTVVAAALRQISRP